MDQEFVFRHDDSVLLLYQIYQKEPVVIEEVIEGMIVDEGKEDLLKELVTKERAGEQNQDGDSRISAPQCGAHSLHAR